MSQFPFKNWKKKKAKTCLYKDTLKNTPNWGQGVGEMKGNTTCLNTVVQVQQKHMEEYTSNCYLQGKAGD